MNPSRELPAEPDAERVTIDAVYLGGPVDLPERRATFADVVSRQEQYRPIVPAWVRSPDGRKAVAVGAAGMAAHRLGWHATRTPKYLAKAALFAPVGAARLAGRAVRWGFDLEGWSIRQEAASRNQVGDYLALSRQRDRRVGTRGWALAAAALLLVVAVVALWLAPRWVQLLAAAVVVPVLARTGRPLDKPIVDRVTIGQRFTRLTAEQVRAALVAIGAAKDPGAVSFPPPGIHRDGPGWLARVDLPQGARAAKVVAQREDLSSALRLPLDQVWPSVGPAHAGQLDLWVAHLPMSRMKPPKWALASPNAVSSAFGPVPFGHDERMRPVTVVFFQRNFLIGGQPGAGKTSGGRSLVLGALLDPTAEMWLAAFKPAEDFYDISEFCARYECGIDDATMEAAGRMVADGLREVQRRQTLLGKLKRDGKIAEGKTSPELARAGLGLHPLFLVFDEVHELFLWSKDVAGALIRLVKQGRSAGVIVILLTQVAGKDSVPPELTRCVSSRWCMSVSDQVANDQIMGTGAYKQGRTGTAFRPEVDAGWGVTDGMAGTYRGPARAYWPNNDELAVVLARLRSIRGGAPATAVDERPTRDLLADVRTVLRQGEAGLPWDALAGRLADLWPETYTGVTGEQIRVTLARWGVPSEDVKAVRADGRRGNVKGARRRALDEAQQRRALPAD